MDRDDFIVHVLCLVDEAVPQVTGGRRLRQRGPQPVVAASEVVTMAVVGEDLGLDQDSALFSSCRRHSAHCFPALRTLHRTPFVRPAANLWWLKEQRWQQVLDPVPHAPAFAIRARLPVPVCQCPSASARLPVPVCQCARASRCRRFRGAAAFGTDTLVRQTCSGVRVPVRREWPGGIVRFCLAPAQGHELAVIPALAEQPLGSVVGDRTSWSPTTAAAWQRHGVALLAPSRSAKRDPHPRWSAVLSRVRYRIATVFGQLVDRCDLKRVWARDRWHLSNRPARAQS